jgi:hypothetical protein
MQNMTFAYLVHSEHWPTLSRCHTSQPDCYGQMCPWPIQCIQNTGRHSLDVTPAHPVHSEHLCVTPASPTAMDIYALGPFSALGALAYTL